MTVISIHDLKSIDAHAKSLRIDPHQLRRFRLHFYKRGEDLQDCRQEIQSEYRSKFTEAIQFHSLKAIEQFDSEDDGATRIIFELMRTGQLLESIILRNEKGRTTLCVSCQIGCAAACTFCATGSMGLLGNLSQSEILDQVIQVNQMLRAEDRRIRNVVFMGMGEPFHNEESLNAAIEILQSPRCFDLEPARILVSTVGVPKPMRRFAERFPRIGLALSLHSARPDVRNSLIPLAAQHSLEKLRDTLQFINQQHGRNRSVMIEYLMLRDVNDRTQDAEALCHFLRGSSSHINLIPYNTIATAPDLIASAPEVIRKFADHLRAAGFTTTIRRSLGADIAAACGQLIRNRACSAERSRRVGAQAR